MKQIVSFNCKNLTNNNTARMPFQALSFILYFNIWEKEKKNPSLSRGESRGKSPHSILGEIFIGISLEDHS